MCSRGLHTSVPTGLHRLDQIYNQAAKFRYMFGGKAETPVVVLAICGAGMRAAAQHSQSLYAMFTHIPGLKCVVPSTPYDAKGLLIESIRDNDSVIFFEHKQLYQVEGEVPSESYTIPLGEAQIVREGGDVTIVTLGDMVHRSKEAADRAPGRDRRRRWAPRSSPNNGTRISVLRKPMIACSPHRIAANNRTSGLPAGLKSL